MTGPLENAVSTSVVSGQLAPMEVLGRGDVRGQSRATLDTDELMHVALSRLTRQLTDEECRTYLQRDGC